MLTIFKVFIEFVTVVLLGFIFFNVFFFFFLLAVRCVGSGASQVVHLVKTLPAKAGGARDSGSIPGSGRFPGGGNGNPLQHSCLEGSVDRGAWRAIQSVELQRVT